MSERRHPRVVNLGEVEGQTTTKGTRFGATRRRLGPHVGNKSLGCTHYEVEPGRTAFPHHFHCMTEEALFVLEGEGTLRIGEEKVAVRAGDWIAFPVGPDNAHQLTNTGTTTLKYLALSNAGHTAEVVGYPDSKKVAGVGMPSNDALAQGKHWVRFITREDASVDYYDGEDIG
jgi:uncharacterized cupin superfamily protein